MKSFGVAPLTWAVPRTLTVVPVVVKVATSAVRSVPKGTVTAIVRAPSSIVPTTAGESPWKLKAVIPPAVSAKLRTGRTKALWCDLR